MILMLMKELNWEILLKVKLLKLVNMLLEKEKLEIHFT